MASDIVEYKAKDGQIVNLNFDVVRKYLIRGKPNLVTNQEIIFFMGICKSKGLNPFKNDCYLVKYSDDPAAVIPSIDYFRSRAKAQSDCAGWNKGLVVKDKKTGEQKKTKGILDRDNEILIGAWFRAQPKNWDEPCEWEVNLSNYIKKTKDGRPTSFWREENQPTQIAKVAESQGLRMCWPDEFQGLYSDAEILAESMEEPEKPKKPTVTKKTYQPKKMMTGNVVDAEFKNPEWDLIQSFIDLTKKPLEQFERKNRNEIQNWPSEVYETFCKKWESKTKQSYETFLRRLKMVQNELDDEHPEQIPTKATKKTKQSKEESKGLGIVKCPETNEPVTFTYCKMAKCAPFQEKSCLARFPE